MSRIFIWEEFPTSRPPWTLPPGRWDCPATMCSLLGLLRGAERGNNIELDEYPKFAGQRKISPGQLPPGVAMTSFSVDDLDRFDLPYIIAPRPLYGSLRAATFLGPAGELTELIEEPAAA